MAPRGNKRSAAGATASPTKKRRADPIYAEIIATLEGSHDLSEHCRDMLIAMTIPCLSVPNSARHDVQQLGVTMIGETLQEHKKKLIEAVATAQKELTDLEASKSTLLQRVDEAKAFLEEKRVAKTAAHTAHEESNAAMKVAEDAQTDSAERQRKTVEALAALEKDKTEIDAAYLEHFKNRMDANEGPSYEFLKPFINHLGLEESLTSALSSSCMKTKEQRGGFDELVLTELGKAFVGRIATLEKSLADEAAQASESKAALVSAQAVLEAKQTAEKIAATDLEAATNAENEAADALDKVSKEWAAFEPDMQRAIDNQQLCDTKRMDFEEGPLKTFDALRVKEIVVPAQAEAAPAGA